MLLPSVLSPISDWSKVILSVSDKTVSFISVMVCETTHHMDAYVSMHFVTVVPAMTVIVPDMHPDIQIDLIEVIQHMYSTYAKMNHPTNRESVPLCFQHWEVQNKLSLLLLMIHQSYVNQSVYSPLPSRQLGIA